MRKEYPLWQKILFLIEDGDTIAIVSRKVNMEYHAISNCVNKILVPGELMNIVSESKFKKLYLTFNGKFFKETLNTLLKVY